MSRTPGGETGGASSPRRRAARSARGSRPGRRAGGDEPNPAHRTHTAEPPAARDQRIEESLDEALEATFPASDPVAITPAGG